MMLIKILEGLEKKSIIKQLIPFTEIYNQTKHLLVIFTKLFSSISSLTFHFLQLNRFVAQIKMDKVIVNLLLLVFPSILLSFLSLTKNIQLVYNSYSTMVALQQLVYNGCSTMVALQQLLYNSCSITVALQQLFYNGCSTMVTLQWLLYNGCSRTNNCSETVTLG